MVPVGMGVSGLVWYDMIPSESFQEWRIGQRTKADKLVSLYSSSAKDQISNQTVAVKKLSDPFKSDSIAKHMFREVKLLKQLQHENVCRDYLVER